MKNGFDPTSISLNSHGAPEIYDEQLLKSIESMVEKQRDLSLQGVTNSNDCSNTVNWGCTNKKNCDGSDNTDCTNNACDYQQI